MFDTSHIGCLDTYRVYVRRPWRNGRALYQPKYKRHVLKFQLVVRQDGLPLYYSGPHIGSRSDIRLWEENTAPIGEGDRLIADKGYYQRFENDRLQRLVVPFKEYKDKPLTDAQRRFNRRLQWVRSTVEHVIGFIKRFAILSDTFRCLNVYGDGADRLRAATDIIMVVTFMHIRKHPKRVWDSVDPSIGQPEWWNDGDQKIAALDAEYDDADSDVDADPDYNDGKDGDLSESDNDEPHNDVPLPQRRRRNARVRYTKRAVYHESTDELADIDEATQLSLLESMSAPPSASPDTSPAAAPTSRRRRGHKRRFSDLSQ
jgi:hypothetical protein